MMGRYWIPRTKDYFVGGYSFEMAKGLIRASDRQEMRKEIAKDEEREQQNLKGLRA